MLANKLLIEGTTLLHTITDVPHLEAELLLSYVKNVSRESLIATVHECSDSEKKRYQELLKKRSKGTSIANLTGIKEFFGLPFIVNEHVLNPRPETELLVETALSCIKIADTTRILDVGTGSGAVAIALAVSTPQSLITATDIDAKALAVARRNACLHKVVNRMRFVRSDLLSRVEKNTWDLIVANLPYLPKKEGELLSGKTEEPAVALSGGPIGYEIIMRLILELKDVSFTTLLLEIDPRFHQTVFTFVRKILKPATVSVINDLAGRYRVISASR